MPTSFATLLEDLISIDLQSSSSSSSTSLIKRNEEQISKINKYYRDGAETHDDIHLQQQQQQSLYCISLLLIWRSFSITTLAESQNENEAFSIPIFDVVFSEPNNNNSNKSSSSNKTNEFIDKINSTIFASSASSPMIDLTTIHNQKEASRILNHVILKNPPQEMFTTTSEKRNFQNFKVLCQLFVISSHENNTDLSEGFLDELIFEDDIKPLFSVGEENKPWFLAKIIFAGMMKYFSTSSSSGSDRNGEDEDKVQVDALNENDSGQLESVCCALFRPISSSSLPNIQTKKSVHAEHCRTIVEKWSENLFHQFIFDASDDRVVTFLDFIRLVISETLASTHSELSPSPLLPLFSLVRLFAHQNFAVSQSTLRNPFLKGELLSCDMYFEIATYLSNDNNNNNNNNSINTIFSHLLVTEANDRQNAIHNLSAFIHSCLYYFENRITCSKSTINGNWYEIVVSSLKELFSDLASSSSSSSTNFQRTSHGQTLIKMLKTFFELSLRFLEEIVEHLHEESEELQDEFSPSFLCQLQSVLLALVYGSFSSSTVNSTTCKVYGVALSQLMQSKANTHERAFVKLSALNTFCDGHILGHFDADAEEEQEDFDEERRHRCAGYCVMIILEGYLEPLATELRQFGNENDILSWPTVMLTSSVENRSACRLLYKYLKMYASTASKNLLRGISIQDIAALILVKSGEAQDEFAKIIVDLVSHLSLMEEEEGDDDEEQRTFEHGRNGSSNENQENDVINGAVASFIRREWMADKTSLADETEVTTINLATRIALMTLQKEETQQRKRIADGILSSQLHQETIEEINADNDDKLDFDKLRLTFWTSAALQLHIEYQRNFLLVKFQEKVLSHSLLFSLWNIQTNEMKLHLIDINTLAETEKLSRRFAFDDGETSIDRRILGEILGPCAVGSLRILTDEAAERAPLATQATSYSSLSWLFEEEKVVRREIVMAEEQEERNGMLECEFTRMVFSFDCERKLRTERAFGGIAIPTQVLMPMAKSVFDNVMAVETEDRLFLGKIFQLQVLEEQVEREEIEAEFFDVFLHDLVVLKRRQEHFVNQVAAFGVSLFSEFGHASHQAWSALVENEWEEGLDNIYQHRQEVEDSDEYFDMMSKRTNKNNNDTKATVEHQQTPTEAAETHSTVNLPTTSHVIILSKHVAKALCDSEVAQRRDIRTECAISEEKLKFIFWRQSETRGL